MTSFAFLRKLGDYMTTLNEEHELMANFTFKCSERKENKIQDSPMLKSGKRLAVFSTDISVASSTGLEMKALSIFWVVPCTSISFSRCMLQVSKTLELTITPKSRRISSSKSSLFNSALLTPPTRAQNALLQCVHDMSPIQQKSQLISKINRAPHVLHKTTYIIDNYRLKKFSDFTAET